jgi:hypothetical protein
MKLEIKNFKKMKIIFDMKTTKVINYTFINNYIDELEYRVCNNCLYINNFHQD